jgi:hypothetical protein
MKIPYKKYKILNLIIYKTIDDVVRSFLPWEIIAKSYFSEPPIEDKPAPPAASKSVIFEDLSEDESEEEERPRSLSIVEGGEDEHLSVTDLDEKEVVVPEVDVMADIESRVSDDKLVLNL